MTPTITLPLPPAGAEAYRVTPARFILGSDVRPFLDPITGERRYELATWFINRQGEKDCWTETLGEVAL